MELKSERDVVCELNSKLPDSIHKLGLGWSLWDSGYISNISFGNWMIWDPETSMVECTEESEYYTNIYNYCIKELAKHRDVLSEVINFLR